MKRNIIKTLIILFFVFFIVYIFKNERNNQKEYGFKIYTDLISKYDTNIVKSGYLNFDSTFSNAKIQRFDYIYKDDFDSIYYFNEILTKEYFKKKYPKYYPKYKLFYTDNNLKDDLPSKDYYDITKAYRVLLMQFNGNQVTFKVVSPTIENKYFFIFDYTFYENQYLWDAFIFRKNEKYRVKIINLGGYIYIRIS